MGAGFLWKVNNSWLLISVKSLLRLFLFKFEYVWFAFTNVSIVSSFSSKIYSYYPASPSSISLSTISIFSLLYVKMRIASFLDWFLISFEPIVFTWFSISKVLWLILEVSWQLLVSLLETFDFELFIFLSFRPKLWFLLIDNESVSIVAPCYDLELFCLSIFKLSFVFIDVCFAIILSWECCNLLFWLGCLSVLRRDWNLHFWIEDIFEAALSYAKGKMLDFGVTFCTWSFSAGNESICFW